MCNFDVHKTSGAEVCQKEDGIVELKILPDLTGNYHLAQLDDGASRTRNHFKWQFHAMIIGPDIPQIIGA